MKQFALEKLIALWRKWLRGIVYVDVPITLHQGEFLAGRGETYVWRGSGKAMFILGDNNDE